MATRVEELMSRDIQSCRTGTSVVDAARVMRDEGIGDVLVIDEAGSLRGMVTDRDVVVRAVAEGRNPAECTVEDVISSDLITVEPGDGLDQVVRLMRERGVRRVPVVDGGHPVGIVSIGDLAIELDSSSALADISAQAPND